MSDDVTMATRILMIEDDARLASMVTEDLGLSGLDVSVAGRLGRARAAGARAASTSSSST
jgi:DNA-binding response OmpR family regulator